MKARTSDVFARHIVEAVRTGSSVDLETRLQELGFTSGDSALIAFAVRITRPELTAPERPGATAGRAAGGCEPSVLDAVSVVFLFNAVNRVATAFGLAPEWSRCRPGERVLRMTRPMLSSFVRLLMYPSDEDQGKRASVETDLQPLLHAVGYQQCSGICELLERHPDLAGTVHRLLSASVDEWQLGEALELSVARSCLKTEQSGQNEIGGPVGANGFSMATAPRNNTESARAICRFAERLFARPYTVSKRDLNELRRQGLDEGRLLDLVFRVAILAGLAKLAAVEQHHPDFFH